MNLIFASVNYSVTELPEHLKSGGILIGFFDFNLVDAIFGVGSMLSRIIYALVGVAGLWGIVMLFQRNVRRMGPCTEE